MARAEISDLSLVPLRASRKLGGTNRISFSFYLPRNVFYCYRHTERRDAQKTAKRGLMAKTCERRNESAFSS